jgi:hypothetical protein
MTADQKPITFNDSGEHFDVAEIDASLLLQRKGSKKYLGFIPELCIVCKTRAAYFSCSPIGPVWSSSEPRLPTLIERSERSMFSPK